MNEITISIASKGEVTDRVFDAFKGNVQGEYITFATPELLFKTLTVKRWDILKAMTGAGALSIRETSRRINRDVKAVHGDITALLKAGIINRTEDGKIEFPFDRVHVDFMLAA